MHSLIHLDNLCILSNILNKLFHTCALFRIFIVYNLLVTSLFLPVDSRMTCTRVVVVGAGAAGIAAAAWLIESGVTDVTILEAADRIGGRIHYLPLEEGGVDLGAHWVHGEEGNPVFEMAHPLGLLHHSQDYRKPFSFLRPDGSVVDIAESSFLEITNNIFLHNITVDQSSNMSHADFVRDRFNEVDLDVSERDRKALLRFFLKFLCQIEGCAELSQVSAVGLQEYNECEGDQTLSWKEEGYNSVLDLLMRRHKVSEGPEIPVMEKVKLNKRVELIEWNGERVAVRCEDGTSLTADIVLVTVSLGVLKDTHRRLFSPALPYNKTQAIQAIGIDVVDKIYLFFEEAWWPQNVSGFALLRYNSSDATSSEDWANDIMGFFSQSSNPKALVIFIVGKGARKMEEASDEVVKETCANVLQQYVGKQFTVPRIRKLIRSKWMKNPNTRGSYSFQSIEADKLYKPRNSLAEPLTNIQGKQVVLFAGEATHPTFFSTVHGAISSGWREADRIINFNFKLNKCSL